MDLNITSRQSLNQSTTTSNRVTEMTTELQTAAARCLCGHHWSRHISSSGHCGQQLVTLSEINHSQPCNCQSYSQKGQ